VINSARLIVLSLVLYQGASELVPRLDLTAEPRTQTPAGAVQSGKRPSRPTTLFSSDLGALPLTVLIDELDERTYAIGDPFVVEVTLRNTSEAPVTLPWSSDRSILDTAAEETIIEGVLALTLASSPGKDQPSWFVGLYGSSSIEGSTMVIAPGRAVQIRAAGRWSFQPIGPDAGPLQKPTQFQARARFSLSRGMSVYPTTRLSTPKIIILTPRPRRG
jgi:hypothetical protein